MRQGNLHEGANDSCQVEGSRGLRPFSSEKARVILVAASTFGGILLPGVDACGRSIGFWSVVAHGCRAALARCDINERQRRWPQRTLRRSHVAGRALGRLLDVIHDTVDTRARSRGRVGERPAFHRPAQHRGRRVGREPQGDALFFGKGVTGGRLSRSLSRSVLGRHASAAAGERGNSANGGELAYDPWWSGNAIRILALHTASDIGPRDNLSDARMSHRPGAARHARGPRVANGAISAALRAAFPAASRAPYSCAVPIAPGLIEPARARATLGRAINHRGPECRLPGRLRVRS